MTDEQLREEVANWLVQFKNDHFPHGLPEKVNDLVCELITDAFIDGVYYGQEVGVKEYVEQQKNKPRIILP